MGTYNLLTQSVLIIMGLLFLVSALAIFGVAFLWSIHRDSKKQTRALKGLHHIIFMAHGRTDTGEKGDKGLTLEELEKAHKAGRPRLGDRP